MGVFEMSLLQSCIIFVLQEMRFSAMAMKRIFSLFFLLLWGAIEGASHLNEATSNNFSHISHKDLHVLEEFFQEVLYHERMIYVLCGSKPMGTCSFFSSSIKETNHNKKIRKGWK